MNSEKFLDAMAYIDDKWIEDVASLRRRPKNITVIWIRRIAVAAACFAITLIGTTALRGLLFPTADCGSSETNESYNYMDITDEDDGSFAGNTSSYIAVRIDEWDSDHVIGTVVEAIDYPLQPNTSIIINFKDIIVFTNNGEPIHATEESPLPTEEEFPLGSVAYVSGEFDNTQPTPTFYAHYFLDSII